MRGGEKWGENQEDKRIGKARQGKARQAGEEEAGGTHVLEKLVALVLCVDKDEHGALFVPRPQQLQQAQVLVRLFVYLYDLRYVFVDRACSQLAHDDLQGQLQYLLGQRLDLLGKRGGEEDSLSVGANVLQHHAELRLEAHVEHPIRLVEHDHGHALQGQ
jgi:hypothetical protein